MNRPTYEQLIAAGQSPAMAEILSTGCAPGLQTDSTFTEGWGHSSESSAMPRHDAYYREKHKAITGRYPSQGQRYLSQLARYPGDPVAWVRGRSDVKRICEQRGNGCEGAVNVIEGPNNHDNPLDSAYQVADSVVDERFARAAVANPELSRLPPEKKRAKKAEMKVKASGVT